MNDQHFNDEQLLAWILDSGARDPQVAAQLEADPDASRRLEQLERFLTQVRGMASAELGVSDPGVQDEARAEDEMGPVVDRMLVDRILARTTREDLSWRGDLNLWAGYLRRRISESGWMKVAAASLLVHLIALPALAFYVFVAAPKAFDTGIIPWEEYRPEDPFIEQNPEAEHSIEVPQAADEPGADEDR